jgi:hypothetical protein
MLLRAPTYSDRPTLPDGLPPMPPTFYWTVLHCSCQGPHRSLKWAPRWVSLLINPMNTIQYNHIHISNNIHHRSWKFPEMQKWKYTVFLLPVLCKASTLSAYFWALQRKETVFVIKMKLIHEIYSSMTDVNIFCTRQLKLLAVNTANYNIITQLLTDSSEFKRNLRKNGVLSV